MYPKIFILKSYNLLLVIIILTVFLSTSLEAATYYWTAQDDGGTKNWSHSQNWSNASGNSISGYPDGTNDNAIFQANAANVTVDRYVRIGKITIKNAYTGTINLNGNILNPTKGFAQNNGTILIPANSDFRVHGGAAILYNGATITSQGNDSNLKIQHNLIFYSGSTINAPGSNSAFEVRGGFRNEGGTFNHNNGTLIMNTKNNWGEAMFKVTGTGSFYNIDFRGNVNKRLHTDITVDNNLYIRGNGDLIGGTSSSGKNITIKGDWWQQSGKNNFTHANGTVSFSGSSNQNITSNNNFRNVIINNTSGVSLVNDLTNITSTLTINSGSTFDINGQDLTAVTLVNNGNFQLLGSETVNITTMDTDSGTVTYDGSGATGLAAGDNYYNLIFNQSGTSTLDTNLDVNGSVSISSGTLDASASNYNINVGGDWTNNGSFISRSGLVTFDNNSDIFAGGTSAIKDFNNVTLSGAVGSQSDNILIGGNFILSGSGTWYTNCNTMTISGSTTNNSGTITNTLAPTVSFDPVNSSSTHAASDNIILTFNTAIRKASDNSDLTDSNVDAHITLKDTNSSGSNINFDATIDASDKVITINPSSDLNSSQVIYVAIGNTVENVCNTALSASSATFTVTDSADPILSSSSPADEATAIAVDSNIVLTFNEAVDADSGNIIIVKSSDGSTVEAIDVTGSQVSGSGSTEITINPSVTLDEQTAYHLTIDETAFDDSSSNSYAGISDATTINFTTADGTAPTIIFNPADGDTGVGRDSNINIEFNEAVVNTNTSEITNSNIASLIALKDSNLNGSDLEFTATIDTDKKIITIDPNNNFSLGQTVYVSILAVEDASANETSLSSSTFTVTTTGAAIATIVPTNSSTDIVASSNITIGFNTAMRNLNDSEITNNNVNSLITLRNTNSSGTAIPFTASINSAKNVITINPIGDFSSGQNVYVAIGTTVEDAFNNAVSAISSVFTIIDNAVPTFTFNPVDSDTNVIVSSNITITFNELIRNINNSTLTDSNVDNLITLKDADSSGSNITFNATIDSDKKIITINPSNNFNSEQVIYLSLAAVEDQAGNATATTSISFTARDSDPPVVSFFPSNSAVNVLRNSDITISFTEAIRNLDNTPITDANIDGLITLKASNSSGADISFDAFIDSTKENITITPTSNLPLNQVIYVAISASVEDEWDNAIAASTASFTTIDDRLSVTFDPADGTTGLPVNTNVIMTFSDAIRHLDDSLITNANVDNLITLEYSFSGSPIPFDATIDSAKKIITINPTNNLIPGDIIYVSIDSVENSSDVATGLAAGTFSVDDNVPPNVLISPSNGSTNVEADAIITIYFDEEIRFLDNTSINNINVDSLITLKDTNSSGVDIAFDATIDIHNQLISINLNENLASEQAVYVAIGPAVEDSYDNAISTTSSVFSTGDTIPPSVRIDAVITVSGGGE
ncbi:Ig-like domain-containing protein [Pelagibacterales bacterium]|nr:Ig-like domain-containing protein [Pelagibacterales bacterium]